MDSYFAFPIFSFSNKKKKEMHRRYTKYVLQRLEGIRTGHPELPNLSSYHDIESVEKQAFNDEIAKRVMSVVSLFEHHRKNYKVHVMDAACARTSTTLVRHGLSPQKLHTFTCNADDYAGIYKIRRGRHVYLTWAESYYTQPQFGSGAHIVIDDGMQTGRCTLPRIFALIERGARFLAILCNLATRNGMNSHTKFAKDVIEFAKSHNYIVAVQKMQQYRRPGSQAMHPLWIELLKDSTL